MRAILVGVDASLSSATDCRSSDFVPNAAATVVVVVACGASVATLLLWCRLGAGRSRTGGLHAASISVSSAVAHFMCNSCNHPKNVNKENNKQTIPNTHTPCHPPRP
jgi:hypothetical protein